MRGVAALLCLAALAALGVALTAQYGFGLDPCHLCLMQRIPYAFAALFAALAALESRDGKTRAMLIGVAAIAFAVDAGFAFYHVGVEWHWWESACSGGEKLSSDAGGLLAKLKQGKQAAACDSVPFELFGVSIAGMNLIAAAILTLIAKWASRRAWRQA